MIGHIEWVKASGLRLYKGCKVRQSKPSQSEGEANHSCNLDAGHPDGLV